MPVPTKTTPIQIDCSTNEGGGQVIRNAIALSAVTSHPVTINSIRANRPGLRGLQLVDLPTIRSLAQVSNSFVRGADIGSTSLTWYPPERDDGKAVKMKYKAVETLGSVFLMFQALYPYLMLAGGLTKGKKKGPIRVDFKGCTNTSSSPSFDYIEQVLAPNMKVLGFPKLKVELWERAWRMDSYEEGSVRCWIHPLPSTMGPDGNLECHFPFLNLDNHQRGKVIKIDITVLAPDDKVSWLISGTEKKEKDKLTIRKFIEQETIAKLRTELKDIPPEVIKPNVPIKIRTSERTYHASHVNVLIVAHTTTSFRLGRDGILNDDWYCYTDGTDEDRNIRDLVGACTKTFALELYDRHKEKTWPQEGTHRACVDRSMRNQVVIFEELGRHSARNRYGLSDHWKARETIEDSRYWSRHTRCARWVCQEILRSVEPT